jgi:DNA-binding NtrC family response regulator
MPAPEAPAPKLLIVDDEPSICWAFTQLLQPEGYEVLAAASAEEGLETAERRRPDLILLDVRLPGMSGLDALPRLRELLPETPVLVMTAYGTMETAIEAIRRGASDYLTKPIHNEEALHRIRAALHTWRLSREVAELRGEAERGGGPMAGKSPAMQEVYKKIGAVAGADCAVLITGESGTGKELVARAVHRYSSRAKGPFLAVNCAALPEQLLESELYGHVRGAFTGAVRDKEGKAETADGGTLFLDEVAELPPGIQAKLLRFLEHKRVERVGATEGRAVDVRILASTNQRLSERIARGLFREDLYYRLNVVSIELPPLRARKDDIPLLVAHFLSRAGGVAPARAPQVSQEALKLLEQYDWPGNVRELKNAIEHAVLLARGAALQPAHLPAHILQSLRGEAGTPGQTMEDLVRARTQRALDGAEKRGEGNVYAELAGDVEKAILEATLKRTGGNQVRASRLLGIHRTTLRKKIEEYGL